MDRVIAPGAPICPADVLEDGGTGVRFQVERFGRSEPAFVIRFHGHVHAYFNRCAHRLVELDWNPGQFFDADRHFLICSSHGALYDPRLGKCLAGPCRGGSLVPIEVEERNGHVWLSDSQDAMLR